MNACLSFVPTQGPVVLSDEVIVQAIVTQWPQLPVNTGWASSPQASDSSAVFLSIAGVEIAIMSQPHAIPWNELQRPASTSTYWPNAVQELQLHDGHIMVAARGPEADRLSVMCLLTHVLWAILRTTPQALGVYNGHAHQVVNRANYLDTAELLPNDLPIMLWVNVRAAPQEPGWQFYTLGMESIGHRDIECEFTNEDPNHYYMKLLGLCEQIIRGNSVFKHGDTLNDPNGGDITNVLFGPSSYGLEGTVMQLHNVIQAKLSGRSDITNMNRVMSPSQP